MASRWIEVALVGRPHGLGGGMHVQPLNPDSDLFTDGRSIGIGHRRSGTDGVGDADTAEATGVEGSHRPIAGGAVDIEEVVIESARQTPRGWLVKIEGVDTREAVAALTGKRLFVRRDALPPLPEDEIYQADLVGWKVQDRQGRSLGTILGFFDNGAHEVCVLQAASQEEVLIPFCPENLVELVEQQGLVIVEIPEGLPGIEPADD
ncbi:MAG: 16S rRNA processing protein RimM [Bradymonadales bacterium]|nr:16S rRNA processing protein RimM [Bradymonadales bacterium]